MAAWSIRNARPEDEPRLRILWRLCFGGDEGADFFNGAYRPEKALVCVAQGEILAMLHRVDITLRRHGTDLPAVYILGVATDPRARRQGMSAALMEQALREARERAIPLAALIPGEASLAAYYARLGFTLRGVRPLLPARKTLPATRKADKDDIPALRALYDAIPNRVLRGEGDWRRILRDYDVHVYPGSYAVFGGGELMELVPFPDAPPHPLAACLCPLEPAVLRGLTLLHEPEGDMPYINLLYN